MNCSADEVLRAVSSEVEIFPRDTQPRINLAHHYESAGNRDAAMLQYLEAVRIRPEDPYFCREAFERAVAAGRWAVAAEVLAEMAKRWAEQPEVYGPAEKELAGMIERLKAAPEAERAGLEKQLRRYQSRDLVVILSWDTQATDVDLHVTEPGGEECFYSRLHTKSGGGLDHDVTTGLGPETYSIRRAAPGTYKIEADYFRGTGRTRVTVKVFRNRGAEDERVETYTAELGKEKERLTVAEVKIQGPAAK